MQPVGILKVGELHIGKFLAARRQYDAGTCARPSAEHPVRHRAARTCRRILHELPARKSAEDTHVMLLPYYRNRWVRLRCGFVRPAALPDKSLGLRVENHDIAAAVV